MPSTTIERLKNAMVQVKPNLDVGDINDDDTFDSELGYDSYDVTELSFHIDMEFGIQFDMSHIHVLKSEIKKRSTASAESKSTSNATTVAQMAELIDLQL